MSIRQKLFLLLGALAAPLFAAAQSADGALDYVLECVDYGFDAVRRDVKVRFEGSEVYIQGISEEVPDGWAHATIEEGVAVFETPQVLGVWGRNRQTQYLTGAETTTGDVSGLSMVYDEMTRSFTSYANNWILLTSDPTTVGVFYDHLYNSVSILPASQAGEDPTVTPPATLSTSVYQLKGKHPFSGLPTDYCVNVGYDGTDVYMQGLYPAFPKAWVKGTIADGKAAFKTPQYIGNYHGLYNMYIAGVDPIAELLSQLVMDYDQATKTFTTTDDNWFIVQAGETNVLPMMLLDEVSIAPYHATLPERQLLTLTPAQESQAKQYIFVAINADDNTSVTLPASVVIEGSDVYVKGISAYFPDAWVKGSLDGLNVVFPRNQYMGSVENNDIWLGAGDTMSGEMIYGNFLLIYNPATGEFTQPDVNYLAINAETTKVFHLEMYKGVVLQPKEVDGIESVAADASSAPAALYDMQGRRVAAPRQHGVYVSGGKAVLR